MKSIFEWRNTPRTTKQPVGRIKVVAKSETGPIVYRTEQAHVLRKSMPEARKIGSLSRNPTTSIATPEKFKQKVVSR